MGTILFLALAACGIAQPPLEVARNPVALDAVPLAARAALEQQSKGRPLHDLVQVLNRDGSISYEGRFRRLGYTYDVEVASNGDCLARSREEPSGDGP